MSNLTERLRPALRWETGLAVVVILILVIGSAASPDFLTGNNLFNLGLSNGEIAIMTLPMTLIVISGEIDLSVASILGMASALLGFLWSRGWPMPAIFVTVAVVGVAAGAVNGLLVTRLRLPSLAVTIGTLALYRGIATILLGPNTVSRLPHRLHEPRRQRRALHRQRHDVLNAHLHRARDHLRRGRCTPPRSAGPSTPWARARKPPSSPASGSSASRPSSSWSPASSAPLAGVLWTFRLNTAVQNNGLGLELSVVAIVLLAGVSIFGGKGSLIGVVLAVLAFAGIQNALLLTNFNQEATGIVTGALLLASVFLPTAGRWLRQLSHS